jgi:signal transduction histidine kinase
VDLEEELEALGRASSGLRGAIYDLRHEKERSFLESVESLVKRNRKAMPGCVIRLVVEEVSFVGPSEEASIELLRVVQEALTNVRRHSRARSVEVRLQTEGETLVAEVTDDGRGFDPEAAQGGVGLVGMSERVEGLGGKIEVRSPLGEGTSIRVMIPRRDDTQAPRRL